VNVKQLLERVPADREAEDRAWAVVRAAYGEREHVRVWPRRRLMLVAVVVAVAAGAPALSPHPAGRSSTPSAGRSGSRPPRRRSSDFRRLAALLVSGGGGTWVVSPDGSKRRLGSYSQAAWSPHGLFVIASTSNELAAIEPNDGSVRWSLARPNVVFPRWGGSRTDTRVAYLSGGRLRIVAGRRHRRRRGRCFLARAAGVAAGRTGGSSRLSRADGRVELLGAWRSAQPLRRATLTRLVDRRRLAFCS